MLGAHHRWRCPLASRHRPATDGNGAVGHTRSLTTSSTGGRRRRFWATTPPGANTPDSGALPLRGAAAKTGIGVSQKPQRQSQQAKVFQKELPCCRQHGKSSPCRLAYSGSAHHEAESSDEK